MGKDKQLSLVFQGYSGKKLEADFDGGNVTSDGGVLFLRAVESKVKIIDRMVRCLQDNRHQSYIDHSIKDILRQRVFQIGCGYEDANDCDELRCDPGFKSACERLPETGADLASQPTMTRLENSVSRTDMYRLAVGFVESFIASYRQKPKAIILDLDDTDDPTHGSQQLSLFNAFYDEYCYQPLHIYEGQSGKLITSILRPGRRMKGREIVSILSRLLARIRKSWPRTAIFLRADSHFGCPEVYEWCEGNGVYYVLGQAGNDRLKAFGASLLACAREQYRITGVKSRLYKSIRYQAGSWRKERRVIVKVEVGPEGENIRFVTTNLKSSRASFIYEDIYCARGRCELWIKNHKVYLRSDRTSCHRFISNQFRLFLHSAAYVLLHALTTTGLRGTRWATAQFDTVQKRLLKVGARVREMATRIKFHFPTSFPLKDVFVRLHSYYIGSVP